MLRAFLRRGGSLLLVTDPARLSACPRVAGLGELYGLSALPGIVSDADTAHHVGSSATYPKPDCNKEHTVTATIGENCTVTMPSSHAIALPDKVPVGVTVTPVLSTSAQAVRLDSDGKTAISERAPCTSGLLPTLPSHRRTAAVVSGTLSALGSSSAFTSAAAEASGVRQLFLPPRLLPLYERNLYLRILLCHPRLHGRLLPVPPAPPLPSGRRRRRPPSPLPARPPACIRARRRRARRGDRDTEIRRYGDGIRWGTLERVPTPPQNFSRTNYYWWEPTFAPVPAFACALAWRRGLSLPLWCPRGGLPSLLPACLAFSLLFCPIFSPFPAGRGRQVFHARASPLASPRLYSTVRRENGRKRFPMSSAGSQGEGGPGRGTSAFEMVLPRGRDSQCRAGSAPPSPLRVPQRQGQPATTPLHPPCTPPTPIPTQSPKEQSSP